MKNLILKFINKIVVAAEKVNNPNKKSEQLPNKIITQPEILNNIKEDIKNFDTKFEQNKTKDLEKIVGVLVKEVALTNQKLTLIQDYLVQLQTSIEVLTNALFEGVDDSLSDPIKDDKDNGSGGMVN